MSELNIYDLIQQSPTFEQFRSLVVAHHVVRYPDELYQPTVLDIDGGGADPATSPTMLAAYRRAA